MSLAANSKLGPYVVLEQLGAGGMGEVYRARDSRLDRDVAIKVLPDRLAHDPQSLARFQREMKAIAALSHPNILIIFDVGTQEGVTYAVTELLHGQTLARRIQQGPLDWREALELALPIADGLAAAHAKGLVHRDIKPANLFLTNDGGSRILDFGLVRLETAPGPKRHDANTPTLAPETQHGVIIGTVAYMSPEQVRGQPADARADVFSFGSVLFEMLTRRAPFARQTDADTVAAILIEPTPRLPPSPLLPQSTGRPPEFDHVVERCLVKDPNSRFANARDVADALRAIARRFLGDLPGRGHAAPTQRLQDQPGSGSRPPMHAGPSVAVLPFVNMSSDPENEFFSDGLAEELITVLSKLEGLRVASRTSAFGFKGKHDDVRRIGQQLGVQTVLEGSVRKSGDRLRISAQLVNVADGYQLWSETFNRQLEDVFAIQDEIAQNIAKALRLLLSDTCRRAIEHAAPSDLTAYEHYLKGRQFFHQLRRVGFEIARQMFSQAIEIDPRYARAHAGLADCHSMLYNNWDASEENRRQADEASQRALELDADLAEAHASRGLALTLFNRHDDARAEFQSAIRLDPQLYEAHYLYARTCVSQGNLTEAAEAFQQASRLRPDDYQALLLCAPVLASLGREEESKSAYERGLRAAQRHVELHPDDARALYLGAGALEHAGERARANEWARRAVAIDPMDSTTQYNVACLYSQQGRVAETIECLRRAVRHGSTRNWKAWLEHDVDFDPIRSHPDFVALLAEI